MIREEALFYLKNGGLWAFCNDVQETLQCLAKEIYQAVSNRGGTSYGHPTSKIMERQFMRIHVCTIAEGPRELFMLKAELKKAAAVAEMLNEETENDAPESVD